MTIRQTTISAMLALATILAASHAWAVSQDQRIKQCQVDNKDEKQKPEAITAYCTCMAGKIPEAQAAPVTEWESSHIDEQKDCAATAQWNFD